MTSNAGEIFNELIAEYNTAQKVREQSESPTPHCVGQFWMSNNRLHISALGPDGKTLLWRPVEGSQGQEDGPTALWV
jgi:hypothetical protein